MQTPLAAHFSDREDRPARFSQFVFVLKSKTQQSFPLSVVAPPSRSRPAVRPAVRPSGRPVVSPAWPSRRRPFRPFQALLRTPNFCTESPWPPLGNHPAPSRESPRPPGCDLAVTPSNFQALLRTPNLCTESPRPPLGNPPAQVGESPRHFGCNLALTPSNFQTLLQTPNLFRESPRHPLGNPPAPVRESPRPLGCDLKFWLLVQGCVLVANPSLRRVASPRLRSGC